jgi:hypothetical protein
MDEFTLTKVVAKHGKQGIIVLPKILESQLKPGTLVQLKITVLKKSGEEDGQKLRFYSRKWNRQHSSSRNTSNIPRRRSKTRQYSSCSRFRIFSTTIGSTKL